MGESNRTWVLTIIIRPKAPEPAHNTTETHA